VSVEQAIARVAKGVSDVNITTADELLQNMGNVIPKDPQFRESFRNHTVSQSNLARYYLRSLEMMAKEESEPYFIPNDDRTVINLEHIFPEKPGDNYPQFPQELASFYFKRIGNLALLNAKQNSDLRSSKFEEKKEAYKYSPYELTRQVSKYEEWTPEAIINRQGIMAELAIKTWPIKIN
jgi:hypothetical protein